MLTGSADPAYILEYVYLRASLTAAMRDSRRRLVQFVLFALGTLAGGSFMRILTKVRAPHGRVAHAQDPYLAVMARTPALGTLWMFTIVRMDLLPACTSLAMVTAYVRWAGLQVLR